MNFSDMPLGQKKIFEDRKAAFNELTRNVELANLALPIWQNPKDEALHSACYRWLNKHRLGPPLFVSESGDSKRLLEAIFKAVRSDLESGVESIYNLIGPGKFITNNARRLHWIVVVSKGLPDAAAAARESNLFDRCVDAAMAAWDLNKTTDLQLQSTS